MSDDTQRIAMLGLELAQAKADLAAARAEVERKDAILRQLAKDGRLWIDVQDLQAARVRLVYQPEHESGIAQARAEAERLRKILLRITWRQDGDSDIVTCVACGGIHPACATSGSWMPDTQFGHRKWCEIAALEGDSDA